MEYRNKEEDQKAETVLRQLGFKPNQIFHESELREKIYLFYNVIKTEEKAKLVGISRADNGKESFFECIMEILDGSIILQKYYRFMSKGELKDLRELEGRT
jgi:hypothetical protein